MMVELSNSTGDKHAHDDNPAICRNDSPVGYDRQAIKSCGLAARTDAAKWPFALAQVGRGIVV